MKGRKPDTLTVPDLDALAAEPTQRAGWTAEEDALIEQFYGRGAVTPKDIAAVLQQRFGSNRQPETVTRRAHVLRGRGLPVPRYGRAK